MPHVGEPLAPLRPRNLQRHFESLEIAIAFASQPWHHEGRPNRIDKEGCDEVLVCSFAS